MPNLDPKSGGRLLTGARSSPKWFYLRFGRKHGPVSSVELRIAAHIGFLGPDDMVQQQGDEVWVLAKAIPGLFVIKPAVRL